MVTRHPRLLAATLIFIALVQFILGATFLLAPQTAVQAMGLSATPDWSNWLFGQMAARFIGFGIGMLVAARNIAKAAPWIWIMILVQAIDWIVTLKYLLAGSVTLSQVSTAPYFPILFIVLLLISMPRAAKQG
jgi:hypothetical protein